VSEHAHAGDSSPPGSPPFASDSRQSDWRTKVTKDEIARIEKFLRKTMQSPTISVRVRPRKTDSAEVYVGEEFIGVVYEDDEDDEKSFNFQMAILAEDIAD
jgi:hypothetical protein